jgi:hypothetical protein
MNFHNGEPSPFLFSLFQKSFGAYCRDQTGGCWSFDYPDGGRWDINVDPKREQMDGFAVSRPPLHPEFCKGLFDLMKATSSFLIWPGGGPVIANASAREHLPQEIIEGFGEPTLVSAPEQILEEIRKS